MVGFNCNYIDSKLDRGRVILRMRTGFKLPSKLNLAIHAYRLDRIISPVYRAIDVVQDAAILNSIPEWRAAAGF